jgi:hypothetical protein
MNALLESEGLTPQPRLLPGEHLEQYQLVRRATLSEIAPRSAIERLLAFDVVELSYPPRLPASILHTITLLEWMEPTAVHFSTCSAP